MHKSLVLCLLASLFVVSCGSLKKAESPKKVWQFSLDNAPQIGKDTNGADISLGGFSSLQYAGADEAGNPEFFTITDRGPNGIEKTVKGKVLRPFYAPEFTPVIIKVRANLRTDKLEIIKSWPMRLPTGELKGLPNFDRAIGLAREHETPVDGNFKALKFDRQGIDPEGFFKVEGGEIWMVEEYRPSLLKFDKEGLLLTRYVPEGTKNLSKLEKAVLPKIFQQRTMNRGFEGLTGFGDKLFSYMQSSLDNPVSKNDSNAKASKRVRILEFDRKQDQPTGEYLYEMESADHKIGDVVALSETEHLVLEQNGKAGVKAWVRIYKVTFGFGTNLLRYFNPRTPKGEPWELEENLQKWNIFPLKKELYMDLQSLGYAGWAKNEGIAVLPDGRVAIVRDNDFGVNDSESDRKTYLTIFAK